MTCFLSYGTLILVPQLQPRFLGVIGKGCDLSNGRNSTGPSRVVGRPASNVGT